MIEVIIEFCKLKVQESYNFAKNFIKGFVRGVFEVFEVMVDPIWMVIKGATAWAALSLIYGWIVSHFDFLPRIFQPVIYNSGYFVLGFFSLLMTTMVLALAFLLICLAVIIYGLTSEIVSNAVDNICDFIRDNWEQAKMNVAERNQ